MRVQTVHESRFYNDAKLPLAPGEMHGYCQYRNPPPEVVARMNRWFFVRDRITFLRQNLARAANRDNPQQISVSLDYLFMLGESQKWQCALSGVPLEFSRGGDWGMKSAFTGGACNPNSCSIDRIDPDKGYVKDNVRLVTSVVNLMRGNLPDKEFVRLCGLIANQN